MASKTVERSIYNYQVNRIWVLVYPREFSYGAKTKESGKFKFGSLSLLYLLEPLALKYKLKTSMKLSHNN